MQSVAQCPICDGINFKKFLSCKDHTVSHETFSLVRCENCELVITSPRPQDKDLGKYYLSDNYVSHSTKKSADLIDQLYKITRHFTLGWKVNLVQANCSFKMPAGPKLLDYGCGTGEFLLKSKASGFIVSGVEPSETARNHANELTSNAVRDSPDKVNGPFDVITLWHVLEHVPTLNEQLGHLLGKLKINGTMFIAVPNHQSFDAQKYGEHWAGYDVPRHLWHFNQRSMKRLIARNAIKLEKVIPMKLDAFYVSVLSQQAMRGEKNLAGMIKGFLDGMRSNLSARKNNEYSSLIYVVRK